MLVIRCNKNRPTVAADSQSNRPFPVAAAGNMVNHAIPEGIGLSDKTWSTISFNGHGARRPNATPISISKRTRVSRPA
jgi:hypothetical protein